MRYKSQRLIELVGGIVLRSYVPHGTNKIPNRLNEFWFNRTPSVFTVIITVCVEIVQISTTLLLLNTAAK